MEPFFCSCLLPSCLFLGVTLSTLDSRLGSSLQFTSWFDFGKVYVDVVGFVVNNNLLDFLLYVVDHKRKIVRGGTWFSRVFLFGGRGLGCLFVVKIEDAK